MMNPQDESEVAALYEQLLNAWNRQDAADFAAQFHDNAYIIGFDGSMMNGKTEIHETIAQIFKDHQTAAYVGKIRGIELLFPRVALLRAVVGMVPPGQTDINPAVNAIQSLVGVKGPKGWRINLFQNTPAQFHGRPEVSAALTEELRQVLHSSEKG